MAHDDMMRSNGGARPASGAVGGDKKIGPLPVSVPTEMLPEELQRAPEGRPIRLTLIGTVDRVSPREMTIAVESVSTEATPEQPPKPMAERREEGLEEPGSMMGEDEGGEEPPMPERGAGPSTIVSIVQRKRRGVQ